MTTLKYTTAFIIQQRIIHPPRCHCPCPDMANTSEIHPVEVPPATAASAGTSKKTKKSTKQKNRNPPEFLDLDSTLFDQCKGAGRRGGGGGGGGPGGAPGGGTTRERLNSSH